MKKLVCTLLSCCMLLGCLPAFAADSADVQMQKALAFVKSKVDVPQELDKFSYQKNDSDTYGGKTAWAFRWTNEDRDASISVESVGDEQIIYYQHTTNTDRDDTALAKVTKEQGQKNAKAFIDKIMPDAIAQTMVPLSSDNSGSEWTYSYIHTVGTLHVTDHTVHINVDKESGSVTWFRGFYENGSAYPSSTPEITMEDAKKLFADEIGLRLVYRSTYDYRKETLNVFPAYVLETGGNVVMADGSMKNLSELRSTPAPEMDKEAGGTSGALNSSDAFTPKELEEIQKVKNLISKEQAVANVEAAFPDAKGAAIKSATLNQDTITKTQYLWSLRLEKDGRYYYATVLANNGDIVSYNCYSDDKEGTLRSEETAKKTLEALLKSLCGGKLSQSKLQETKEQEIMPLPGSGTAKTENPHYTVRYVRQANGIPYENNFITATYNRATGNVESFNCTWYPDAKFADISKAKPESEMLELLYDSLHYALNYRDLDGVKYLCFDFEKATNAYFDPFSGARIGYNGQPYEDDEAPFYTDIDNHWCRDMALSLLENGVYFEGGKLNPETNVTQADFLRLLYESQQMYADEDNEIFYKDAVRRGILTQAEVNPAGTVSRASAARYIIRMMGFDKAAQLTGIYHYPFSDAIDPSDVGYVTLCYGFGIVKGDESGNFNPNTAVTRAAAISMIYYKMTV